MSGGGGRIDNSFCLFRRRIEELGSNPEVPASSISPPTPLGARRPGASWMRGSSCSSTHAIRSCSGPRTRTTIRDLLRCLEGPGYRSAGSFRAVRAMIAIVRGASCRARARGIAAQAPAQRGSGSGSDSEAQACLIIDSK